ncbi:NADPH-dependent ferric siderophore reductase [Actinomycetospora succinea]|uniref:NADPH-dependent ferric siderophore reductase n=1 Tax=Actinomycetospora succinea TaxID=663603 RepID=A0A4R6VS89_9PSEU|nr:siderophore-interacting protein [Actinomycetospora succinea]TDQ65340.1 NADPH-dependent ferric siderophore reductase [Actinomycetospora succinea]
MDRDRPRERVAEARRGEGGAKVPYPIRIRRLEVTGTRRVGPAMLRLTLGGPELAGFESHSVVDEHVKLVFPDDDGGLRLPEANGLMLFWPKPMPPTRDYTVRRHDPDTGELDLDFVLHPGGLASEWASRAKVGEPVWVAGPPAGLVVPERYDHYLLAGDTTALPAIERWVGNMPATARGWVFVEVADASEETELRAPAGVTVTWLHREGVQAGRSTVLADAVQTVSVPPGESVYVWVAGEAGSIKPLRRWVRDDLGLPPADVSITGYWKLGLSMFDEDHNPGEGEEAHGHGHGHAH